MHTINAVAIVARRVVLLLALAVLLPVASFAQNLYVTSVDPSLGSWIVNVINPVTGAQITQIPDPTTSNGQGPIVVTPDGSTVYTISGLSVIDTATNAITGNFSVSVGLAPFDLAMSPDGTAVYVLSCTPGINGCISGFKIDVVSTATNNVVSTITLPNTNDLAGFGSRHGILVTPNGGEIYISRTSSTTGVGYISVYNVSAGTFSSITSITGFIADMAITPDGTELYVSDNTANSVLVISTSSHGTVTTVSAIGPLDIAITPDGSKAYILSQNQTSCPSTTQTNCLNVVNTATHSVTKRLASGLTTFAFTGHIIVTPDGSSVYNFGVLSGGAYGLAVAATATDTIITTISGYTNFSAPVFIATIPPSGGSGATSVLRTLGVCACDNTKKPSDSPIVTPGQVTVPRPITISNGNMYEVVTDYTTVGQNPLQFIRYYNSQASTTGYASTLVEHWRHNYDRYLRVVNASLIKAERQDGKILNFVLSGGNWITDSDIDAKLTNPSGSTWVLTDGDDTTESYTVTSGKGLLDTITYRGGYTQTLAYSSGVLQSVTDSYSRALGFTYSSGRLSLLSTPETPTFTYGYTSAGGSFVLTSVTYNTTPSTTQQTYAYAASGLPFALTSITDENGVQFNTWTYDSFGRATSSTLGTGGTADVTSVSYTGALTRTVTNALGQTEDYTFAYLQGVPKLAQIHRNSTATTAAATRTFTYDSNGFLASATDWNGTQTTYTNNARGLPTSIVEAVGVTGVTRTTTITYNTTFHSLPDQIVKSPLTTNFTYDSNGNMLTKAFTDGTTTRTWTYTWSNFLMATAQNPRSKTTTYTYGSDGALTKIRNALTQDTDIVSHTGGGRPTQILAPDGTRTWPVYDNRLRVSYVTTSWTPYPVTTYFTYDAAGNLLTVTPPDMLAQTFTYDTAHRLTKIEDSSSNSITYTLNAMGNRTATVFKAGSTTKRSTSASRPMKK